MIMIIFIQLEILKSNAILNFTSFYSSVNTITIDIVYLFYFTMEYLHELLLCYLRTYSFGNRNEENLVH